MEFAVTLALVDRYISYSRRSVSELSDQSRTTDVPDPEVCERPVGALGGVVSVGVVAPKTVKWSELELRAIL